jgi:glycosyltransferase involved in cell wall biosynthesis
MESISPEVTIVVVDDGSTDGTPELVSESHNTSTRNDLPAASPAGLASR